MPAVFADRYNLNIVFTGQLFVFMADGIEVLKVDATSVNLIDDIRRATDEYYNTAGR